MRRSGRRPRSGQALSSWWRSSRAGCRRSPITSAAASYLVFPRTPRASVCASSCRSAKRRPPSRFPGKTSPSPTSRSKCRSIFRVARIRSPPSRRRSVATRAESPSPRCTGCAGSARPRGGGLCRASQRRLPRHLVDQGADGGRHARRPGRAWRAARLGRRPTRRRSRRLPPCGSGCGTRAKASC